MESVRAWSTERTGAAAGIMESVGCGDAVGKTSAPMTSKRTRLGLCGGLDPLEERRKALRGVFDSLRSEWLDETVSLVERRTCPGRPGD
ncbi:hypothetical protein HG531_011724 [Fusarium graminearum]|nr:hypothetical protein HG531_011724 [Fusarium graminearum]